MRDQKDQEFSGKIISMRNLICVGEEKAHPPDRVKANGEEIVVKYKDKNNGIARQNKIQSRS